MNLKKIKHGLVMIGVSELVVFLYNFVTQFLFSKNFLETINNVTIILGFVCLFLQFIGMIICSRSGSKLYLFCVLVETLIIVAKIIIQILIITEHSIPTFIATLITVIQIFIWFLMIIGLSFFLRKINGNNVFVVIVSVLEFVLFIFSLYLLLYYFDIKNIPFRDEFIKNFDVILFVDLVYELILSLLIAIAFFLTSGKIKKSGF